MKRVFKRIIPAALLIAIGIFAANWFLHREEPGAEVGLLLHGNIDIRDVDLAFNEEEHVIDVLVEEGDRVEKGQVLARQQTDRLEAQIVEVKARIAAQQQVVDRLETGTRPQEIDQARAEVEAGKVRLDNSKRILERIQKTAGTGATSQQDLDDARSRVAVDEAQLKVMEQALSLALEGPRKEDIAEAKAILESLDASLELLNIRLADRVLSAPSAGVIQSRLLEPGDIASPERPVFILALLDPKWVRAYVPEPSLGLINLGMKAKVESDSFPKRTFEGWVGFISSIAEFTPKAVETEELRTKLVYEVRIFVRDHEDCLRLGMPVTVVVDRAVPDQRSNEPSGPGKGS